MENNKGQNQLARKQLEKNTNKRNPFSSENQHFGLNIESVNDTERSIQQSEFREMLEMDADEDLGSGSSQRESKLMKHLKAFEDRNNKEDEGLDHAVLLEDDSMSATSDLRDNGKIREALVALLLQMRLCNVDEDMAKEDKIREETQKLGTMALIRIITKRVEQLINFKLLNDIQKDDGKQGQSDTMRNLLKDIHQRSQMSGLDEVEQMSGNLDEFEILHQQAKDLSKPAKKRYDVEKKDESEVQSQSDSHFTSIAGPPEVYEEIMQGLEADIRKHIRIEHQLKLHIESMEDRVEELEREQEGYLKQINDMKKHKVLYLQVKKELASKEEILDVKQVLLQKQKNEIQEGKRIIAQVESEVLELKNTVQSLQIEKMNLLKQAKQNQMNKYNDMMQVQQNNPYNSFLEDSSMIQINSNKPSGQPSAMSNQSLGSEMSQKNQGSIGKGKISLIQQNINKKSHDQLSLIEYNKAVGLSLQAKATSSTRNTQIYNNTSSQLGFMNTSQTESSNRMGSQTRNQHLLSSQKPANTLKASHQTNPLKSKQNKSLTVGSNRIKQEKSGKSGNGSLSQTPNANENMFYSQQIQKNTKIKQKQVHIEKLNSLQGAQQALHNTATAHSALNLTSGLLGPQLQLNMTANPMQQVSQIYSLQGHTDEYKKSRTPDKVKLKSKTKPAKKDAVSSHPPQTGEFTLSKQGHSQAQHLQSANSRSQSQQAQYAQIPERLFTTGRGGHAQNQSNTAQRLDSGQQDYHAGGMKASAAMMAQPKSSSMNTTGVLSNQQQKLTSKAKLQNIYSSNQNRKQQFRNNKNHVQSQERQYQQLLSSAVSLGSQGQQRMTTGASRNGGLNTYNTVSAANIGEQNATKLGEQKKQVMHNQWVLSQENDKNQKANHNYIHNQEIKTVLKSGLDNSSTGAADSSSIKALQRRCSSQMQNQPTNKVSGQAGAKELDYSRAILNISQSSTDKVKSSKISQSSLNNTQKLKSSSRKGGNSAKRQTQPKLKKDDASEKYGQDFVNVVFQNRIIPSRDANSSSVLGKVIDDKPISQMQKQIPRVNNSKGQ